MKKLFIEILLYNSVACSSARSASHRLASRHHKLQWSARKQQDQTACAANRRRESSDHSTALTAATQD